MDETSRQQDAAGEGITSGQDGGRGPSPHQQWKDRPSAPHEEDDDDREDLDGGHERISESAAKRAERNCETNSQHQYATVRPDASATKVPWKHGNPDAAGVPP